MSNTTAPESAPAALRLVNLSTVLRGAPFGRCECGRQHMSIHDRVAVKPSRGLGYATEILCARCAYDAGAR